MFASRIMMPRYVIGAYRMKQPKVVFPPLIGALGLGYLLHVLLSCESECVALYGPKSYSLTVCIFYSQSKFGRKLASYGQWRSEIKEMSCQLEEVSERCDVDWK